jgi:hypothetical protein
MKNMGSIAETKKTPKFRGKQLKRDHEFGLHTYNKFGRELVERVNGDFAGTHAALPPYNSQRSNHPVKTSNAWNLFARDMKAREMGVRVAYPEDSEMLLFLNKLPEKGQAYFNLALALDFSSANHDLATNIYSQVKKRNKEEADLDRLPAILLGLGVERTDKQHNLGFIITNYSIVRPSPILSSPIEYFHPKDPELLRTGLPSKLGGGDRKLWTARQKDKSMDNLGVLSFYLNGDLVLGSNYSLLDCSGDDGRVVLIGIRNLQDNFEINVE